MRRSQLLFCKSNFLFSGSLMPTLSALETSLLYFYLLTVNYPRLNISHSVKVANALSFSNSSRGHVIIWMNWVMYDFAARHSYKLSISKMFFYRTVQPPKGPNCLISILFSVWVWGFACPLFLVHSLGSTEPWQMFSLR